MKAKKYLLTKILLGLIFIIFINIPLMRQYYNVGDDTGFHLLRISEIHSNLKSEYILPTIYSNTLNGYGYANPFFYPDLFLYIPALLMCLGISLVNSYKIFILILNISTFIITYLSVKRMYNYKDNRNLIAYITAIIYTGGFYRIITVYIRGALGEMIGMAFVPLIVCGMIEVIKKGNSDYKKRKNRWILLTIGFTCSIYSHLITTYIMALTVLVYFTMNFKKIFGSEKRYKEIIKAGIATIGLTAPFTLTMLYMMSKDIYNVNMTYTFPLTSKLFNIISMDSINKYKHFAVFLVISISVLLLLKLFYRKYKLSKQTRKAVNLIIIFIYTVLGCTNLIPWDIISTLIPKLDVIQFPFRLLSIGIFFGALGLSLLIETWKDKEIMYIIFIPISTMILSSMFILMTPQASVTSDYNITSNFVGQAEYIPYGANLNEIMNRGQVITSEKGTVEIISDNRDYKNRAIAFKTYTTNNSLELPYIYYHGYEVSLNGKEIESYKSPNSLLSVNLGEVTEGILTINYNRPVTVYLGLISTLITLGIIILKRK